LVALDRAQLVISQQYISPDVSVDDETSVTSELEPAQEKATNNPMLDDDFSLIPQRAGLFVSTARGEPETIFGNHEARGEHAAPVSPLATPIEEVNSDGKEFEKTLGERDEAENIFEAHQARDERTALISPRPTPEEIIVDECKEELDFTSFSPIEGAIVVKPSFL
jgi:hypothetical protein